MTDVSDGVAPSRPAAPAPDPSLLGGAEVTVVDEEDPGELVLDQPRVIEPPSWDGPSSVIVSDLAKWYDRRRRSGLRAALPFALPDTPPRGAVVALDGVDLEIGEGQSVGIIGNNGAGKSTLLRLIAGVTSPSRGQVAARGRVASMIELGLGFHPEMSGAENLEFGAGLLGMSRSTLRSRWDEIIEFSGVGYALDQPVKQYSSGMLARLGFALASHCDAEIVLIDEVLSVGDYDFQHRSFGRIGELRDEGRTTVVVTHNLDALPALCTRIVQFEQGRLVADGVPRVVLPDYVAEEERKLAARANLPVVITGVELDPPVIPPSGELTVRARVQTLEPLPDCRVVLRVGFGAALMEWAGESEEGSLDRLADEPLDIDLAEGPGMWQVEAKIRSFPLFPGEYMVGVAVLEPDLSEINRSVLPLQVEGDEADRKSLRLPFDQENRRLS